MSGVTIEFKGDQASVWWSEEAGELLKEITGDEIESPQEFLIVADPEIEANGLCG